MLPRTTPQRAVGQGEFPELFEQLLTPDERAALAQKAARRGCTVESLIAEIVHKHGDLGCVFVIGRAQ
jgi:hypothetical protein